MTRFPKLRPVPWDGAVVLTVLMLAGILVLRPARILSETVTQAAETASLWAVVYIDGAEADREAVDNGEVPRARDYTNNGYLVRVLYRPEDVPGVQVVYADCPSQVCVYTGRITRPGQLIVCLPSRIVVRLEGGASDVPDAVVG